MRWLLRLVLLAAVVWGGYWWVGSRALNQGARDWFAQQGDRASYADLSVAGFPNRFDLTITEPRITDAATGITWDSSFVQVFTLTYSPWHMIAAFAPNQRLETPAGQVNLRSEKLQASLVLTPRTNLPLDRMSLVGEGLVLQSDSALAIQTLRFATRRIAGDAEVHEVGLDIAGLAPDPTLLVGLDLPESAESLRLTLKAGFSGPLDRFAVQDHPQMTTLELETAWLQWGDVGLTGQGRVVADASGLAEGTLTLQLTNWEKALNLAAALGLIDVATLPSLTNAAQFLALSSTDTTQITLDLRFGQGITTLAGLPIGPAPRLRQ